MKKVIAIILVLAAVGLAVFLFITSPGEKEDRPYHPPSLDHVHEKE